MSRLIIVEPTVYGAMVAMTVDGRLEDLLIDAPDDQHAMEEIHLVRVKRIIRNQGGAHVKLGDGGTGFLRDARGLKEGQLVTAQVSGLAGPGKATPMTASPLFRGRYVILTPGASGLNVARSLKDKDERTRLAAIAEGAGLDSAIVRSRADGADEASILEDIEALKAMKEEVASGASARTLDCLAAAPGAEIIAWREWPEPDEVIQEDGAFDRLGLWDQIDALRSPRAELNGGGWMAIEPTAAMIAVDINTGADLSPQAAATANLSACADLPRQLRLRGLGGQITVDFAPMRKSDRKAVEGALQHAFKSDPVQTTLAGWTPLGNFELTRKRERRPFSEVLSDV
ncbi:MAG: ribonuclease E/G [Pseudomonadota bacterium]